MSHRWSARPAPEWHRRAEPAKSEPEGNAADAGPQKEHFAHETSAYARNVFHDVHCDVEVARYVNDAV